MKLDHCVSPQHMLALLQWEAEHDHNPLVFLYVPFGWLYALVSALSPHLVRARDLQHGLQVRGTRVIVDERLPADRIVAHYALGNYKFHATPIFGKSTLTVHGDATPKTSTKGARKSFHVAACAPGKRFATANGFARTEALFPCQNLSGKGCSGKPSLFEEEKAAKDCDCRRSTMSIQHIVKLLVALVETVAVMRDAPLHKRAEVVELTQELKQLMGLKEQ